MNILHLPAEILRLIIRQSLPAPTLYRVIFKDYKPFLEGCSTLITVPLVCRSFYRLTEGVLAEITFILDATKAPQCEPKQKVSLCNPAWKNKIKIIRTNLQARWQHWEHAISACGHCLEWASFKNLVGVTFTDNNMIPKAIRRQQRFDVFGAGTCFSQEQEELIAEELAKHFEQLMQWVLRAICLHKFPQDCLPLTVNLRASESDFMSFTADEDKDNDDFVHLIIFAERSDWRLKEFRVGSQDFLKRLVLRNLSTVDSKPSNEG